MISIKVEKHRKREKSPSTSPKHISRAKTPFCAQPPPVQPEIISYPQCKHHNNTSVCKPRCCLAAKSHINRKEERPRSILQLKSLTSTEVQSLTRPETRPQRPPSYSDSRRQDYLLQKNFEEIRRCRYIRRKETMQDSPGSPKQTNMARKPIKIGKVNWKS